MPTIRASSLPGFADCQLRAASQMWWKEFKDLGFSIPWSPKSVASQVGISTHVAVAQMLQTKVATGSLGNVDEAASKGVDDFDEAVRKGAVDFADDPITPTKGVGKDQIAQISRIYAATQGFRLRPQLVEPKMVANLGKVFSGWQLTGGLDHLTQDGDLPDLKTGYAGIKYATQLGGYNLLCRANNIPVKRVGTLRIGRTKPGAVPDHPEEFWMDPSLAARLAWKTIKRSIAAYEDFVAQEEDPDPLTFDVNPTSPLCSAKYCSFWTLCPIGKAKAKGDL